MNLGRHYRVRDPGVACAALSHDTVEDHVDDIAGTPQAAPAVLARMFGERTAELVAAVTNPNWEPGVDRDEQYREHVAASLEASPWARVIKASEQDRRPARRRRGPLRRDLGLGTVELGDAACVMKP